VHVSRVGVQGGHGGVQGAQGQPLVQPEPTSATVAELDLGDGAVQGDKVTQGLPMATRQVSCSESIGRAVACDPPYPTRPGVVIDGMQAVKQLDE
jgi:hypothetical protein